MQISFWFQHQRLLVFTVDQMVCLIHFFGFNQDVWNSVLRWCGNGLRGLEEPRMAKVGLIAHPKQNLIRNMTGTLFLMHGGHIMSKWRILNGLRMRDFNLEGIWVWREIQIIDGTHNKYHYTTHSGWKWWQSGQSGALNNVWSLDSQKWHQQGVRVVAVVLACDKSVIQISRQTRIPSRLKFLFQMLSKILNLLIMRPSDIKNKVPVMFLI